MAGMEGGTFTNQKSDLPTDSSDWIEHMIKLNNFHVFQSLFLLLVELSGDFYFKMLKKQRFSVDSKFLACLVLIAH